MYATAFNTGPAAVQVDREGRQILSGDWGTIETTDDLVRAAGDVLVVHDDPGEGVDIDPRAREAFDRTAAIAARAETLQGLDKPDLVPLAVDAGVPGAEDLNKPDLVAALAARADVNLPEAAEETSSDEDKPGDEDTSPPARTRRSGAAKQ